MCQDALLRQKEFSRLLQRQFDQENITLHAKQALDISTAARRAEECDLLLPFVDYKTIVTVEVQVVRADFSTLDKEQKTAIAEAFVSSYNSLVASYTAIHFFRYVTKANVVQVGSLRNGENLPIKLAVVGKCCGCNADGFGLYEVPYMLSSPNRLLWNNQALKDGTGHRD
jgi:hypothetical protein